MTDVRDLAWPVYLVEAFDTAPAPGATIRLAGEEARHAVAVRRHRLGQWLVAADGAGRWAAGPIVAIPGKAAVEFQVDRYGNDPPPSPGVTVVQALPKSDRADDAVEFLTAVGVDHLVPWQAERSVARWSSERTERGLARWRRTAREAAKQSRRVRLPRIDPPVDLAGVAELVAAADLAVVCHEQALTSLAELTADPQSAQVVIVIGPEGGISEAELATLRAAGAQPVSLGPTVLRTSVAGGLAAGLVLAKVGRLSAPARGASPTGRAGGDIGHD